MRLVPEPTLFAAAAFAALSGAACAQADAGRLLAAAPQAVEISANYLNAVGTSDAASEGVATSALIASRPVLRPAEVLEFVPGLVVTQHSGDGKANQYFLRGFDLDHGTDFATWVDGMPANMPTHAHGQGYADLNWLIPELVDRIAYRKGPYRADEGDFSSAGSAHIRLVDALPRGLASQTLGERGYARTLLADTVAAGPARLLGAIELARNDGPWEHPERFHRADGMLRLSLDAGGLRQSLTALAYEAAWDSTDQVPLRAVRSGAIGRFGAIDPTDGGRTSRYSLSYAAARALDDGELKLDAYAIASRLDLFSDFTYFLADPVNGDQFEQAERRRVAGFHASRRWDGSLAGHDSSTTLGLQWRADRLAPVGLYDAVARQRTAVVQESRVRETAAAAYVENATTWTPWLRSVAGLRLDRLELDVASSIRANSGRRDARIASPKLTLVFGPWARTELFANAALGFHSNDARGATETVTPRDGLPATPVTPLVRSRGAELGLRTQALPGLQSSLALWALRLDSELVFSGDAGDTEPSRASLRAGVEWNNHYAASSHVLLDADLAFSHARHTQRDAAGSSVPGAVGAVASLGATLKDWGAWSGQLQLRHFGPRPLAEDAAVRSRATTLAYLRVARALGPATRLSLDVFNLFDRKASDIDYDYVSRLPGEPPGGVRDLHFHPVEPRTARLTLATEF